MKCLGGVDSSHADLTPNRMVWGYNGNRHTFKGSKSGIFNVASLPNRGRFLRERICSSKSRFYPLRVDPVRERLIRMNSRKLFSFVKMAENMKLFYFPGSIRRF